MEVTLCLWNHVLFFYKPRGVLCFRLGPEGVGRDKGNRNLNKNWFPHLQVNKQMKLTILGKECITVTFTSQNETVTLSVSAKKCPHKTLHNKRVRQPNPMASPHELPFTSQGLCTYPPGASLAQIQGRQDRNEQMWKFREHNHWWLRRSGRDFLEKKSDPVTIHSGVRVWVYLTNEILLVSRADLVSNFLENSLGCWGKCTGVCGNSLIEVRVWVQ